MALSSVCVVMLDLSALASPDAPILLDQLGAVAGQQYQGDSLAVSLTAIGRETGERSADIPVGFDVPQKRGRTLSRLLIHQTQ